MPASIRPISSSGSSWITKTSFVLLRATHARLPLRAEHDPTRLPADPNSLDLPAPLGIDHGDIARDSVACQSVSSAGREDQSHRHLADRTPRDEFEVPRDEDHEVVVIPIRHMDERRRSAAFGRQQRASGSRRSPCSSPRSCSIRGSGCTGASSSVSERASARDVSPLRSLRAAPEALGRTRSPCPRR